MEDSIKRDRHWHATQLFGGSWPITQLSSVNTIKSSHVTDDEHDDDYEDYGDVNFDGDDDDDEYKNCIYGKKKNFY